MSALMPTTRAALKAASLWRAVLFCARNMSFLRFVSFGNAAFLAYMPFNRLLVYIGGDRWQPDPNSWRQWVQMSIGAVV